MGLVLNSCVKRVVMRGTVWLEYEYRSQFQRNVTWWHTVWVLRQNDPLETEVERSRIPDDLVHYHP